MKYNYIKVSLIIIVSIFISACSQDFLNEDMIRQESTQSFETEEGLDKLSIGMYQNLRIPFTYEWAYPYWNFGTDEFTSGRGGNNWFNDYTDAFNSAASNGSAENWDHMFAGIGSANTLLANVPLYYSENNPNYNTRLGEGYFMRGYNYFRLVIQFGGVPLLTEPVKGAQTDFVRASAEEVYAQIISDLKKAYELLPASAGDQPGRFTKSAAAHFIAKASLFRVSEINSDWNSSYKDQDLDEVIKYGKLVIDAHPLATDFSDLWAYEEPDGASERLQEIVLSAQFSNLSTGRTGNQVHLYFLSVYQNLPGLKRDISGGREYRRLRATNYAQDVYDRVNDSRFWKSFVTSYNSNNPGAAPKWAAPYTPVGKNDGDPKFGLNEEAVRYIVNDAGDNRYTTESIKYRAPHMFVRYFADQPQSYLDLHGNYGHPDGSGGPRFLALGKYRDGSRPSVAAANGYRDGVIARSAEDYLMVAEAYGRKGQYTEALPYINALRERAAYKEGEDRSKYVDGGAAFRNNTSGSGAGDGAVYSDNNTYYESNNIEGNLTESTVNNLVLSSVADIFSSTDQFYTELGASSDMDKFLVFIMNERSRELMGELHRWPDLARSKQLEKRFKTFNDGVREEGSNFNANKHYLRPIPQSFLDAITKDGQALTSEEKQAMQNPGW
ncbi:MAG: RagB/SusD family nutrient uptake outer membrane protein [Fermentimonas sp.]|jgi:hypothetical protein|nr:RagB/SusD family nutrient uptake outer membrane protein [Fermentimonas sp.]MDD4698259.1 RagB/SusD family nutrient uptake outer membrane protein [Fermentimonas sp.]